MHPNLLNGIKCPSFLSRNVPRIVQKSAWKHAARKKIRWWLINSQWCQVFLYNFLGMDWMNKENIFNPKFVLCKMCISSDFQDWWTSNVKLQKWVGHQFDCSQALLKPNSFVTPPLAQFCDGETKIRFQIYFGTYLKKYCCKKVSLCWKQKKLFWYCWMGMAKKCIVKNGTDTISTLVHVLQG